ncbi:purine and uridine phosphorylase [Cenococcum geophilum 1.58]|uniref:purine and uridine phosphorylase n=1 Tax=Cenococcum geophilum 1.58 TaxID=794803 RepID=UPI00358F5024|nr:purine and uridine phosphorylase [Cenococcum geophilum 1.58]
MSRRLRREEYTIGWVCALPVELAAAQEMLDEEHEDLERDISDHDENLYSLGSVAGHNVVLVCLPAGRIGNNPAAAVATQMRATFKGIRFGLMVGIGGGVPSAEVDIRLGDVVVSQPHQTFGGVVQYDLGKATPSGFERTGSLNSPPQMLLGAVARVRANELRGRSKLSKHVSKLDRIPKFQHDKTGPDVLFEATYDHEGGQTCNLCNTDRQEARQPRESEEEVVVHYGTIASGNQVIRDGRTRDRVSRELGGILCFEMEAAGLMNSFPCLVIRGICDYADSHKNKRWQAYAAGMAAACAKEVLSVIPPADVAKTCTVEETIRGSSNRVTTSTYYIPFPRNRYFVGRRAELNVLKRKLIVNQECQRMSVVGLGGTGKTQIVLQFAYTVKETWPEFSIFWAPTLSMESFEQACADIARALHIPQAAGGEEDAKELVRQHLSAARAGRWLLVVDNADDAEILFGTGQSKGIVDYLPESEEGVVVFTTRTLEVAVSLTRGDVIELGAMNRQDAVSFLEKSLIRKDLVRDDAATTELLDELACLPLAIAQAAAYLNMNRMSIAKYLRLLRNTEHDIIGLMSREFRDDTRYKGSANAVATTWVVSFSQIRARDTVAADLLSFMSCIEWKAIPRSILPGVQPEERMEDAIGTLCAYSFLVKRDDEDRYDIHRLVHLATRVWISQHGDIADEVEKAIQHVVEIFPSNDYANRAVWRAYLPHALRLLGGKEDCDVEERSELCLLVGQCLQVDGRIQEAVKWLEECCQWRSRLDEKESGRLLSQHMLAMAYEADGQVKKAMELLEHIVAVEAKVLAEEHPSRLASQHALAGAYRADDK